MCEYMEHIYSGKHRIHMKMAMMRKGEEKQKCHVRKYNTKIKMRRKNIFVKTLHPT